MAATTSESGTRRVGSLGLLAVGVVSVEFVLVGDLLGIGAALALLVAWYALPAPSAVALGFVLFAVLLPVEPGTLELLVGTLGLLGVLAAAVPSWSAVPRFGVPFVVGWFLLGGVAALGFRVGGLGVALVSLAALALLAGYGLHRYELLRLGLLTDPASAGDPGSNGASPGAAADIPTDEHTDTTPEA